VSAEQLTGESIMRIQGAIEAVTRAIEDERPTNAIHEVGRQALPVS
jgi:DNA-binding FrmR family transcriptional regulator